VDQVDQRILGLLRDNARIKNMEIARKIGLTEGAVRARIRKLVDSGIIERFTIQTRAAGVEGFVMIETRAERTKQVAARVRQLSSEAFETSGDFDVAARLVAEDLAGLNSIVDQIRSIPGVVKTTTLLKLTRE